MIFIFLIYFTILIDILPALYKKTFVKLLEICKIFNNISREACRAKGQKHIVYAVAVLKALQIGYCQ